MGLSVRCDVWDDAHRLVAEDVSLVHEGTERLVQVQVGSADVRGGHAHDGVGGLLDLRVGHVVDAYVALAVPGHCPRSPQVGDTCTSADLSP
jgi:hypothetical protein